MREYKYHTSSKIDRHFPGNSPLGICVLADSFPFVLGKWRCVFEMLNG